MKEIRLKISDIFEIEPQIPDQPRGLAAITAYVLKHYAFLPQPIAVTVEGDEVVISYPEEADTKREEAARLAARAVKRASEGQYDKAIGVYKRVLELQPLFHDARRDLAMAYMELGDVENATNHLIEVLRLDPKDAWSWVVLGNLYVREKNDRTFTHGDRERCRRTPRLPIRVGSGAKISHGRNADAQTEEKHRLIAGNRHERKGRLLDRSCF